MGTGSIGTRLLGSLAAAGGVTLGLFGLMISLLPGGWEAPPDQSLESVRFVSMTPPPPPEPRYRQAPKPVKIRQPAARPELKLPDLELMPRAALATAPRMDRSQLDLLNRPTLPDIPDLGSDFALGNGLVPKVLMPPMYPPRGLSKGIEGEVVVRFTVNPRGEVIRAEIVTAKPENMFEHATLRAVRRWRFQPVLVDGEPATVTAMQTIGFSLVDDITVPEDDSETL